MNKEYMEYLLREKVSHEKASKAYLVAEFLCNLDWAFFDRLANLPPWIQEEESEE